MNLERRDGVSEGTDGHMEIMDKALKVLGELRRYFERLTSEEYGLRWLINYAQRCRINWSSEFEVQRIKGFRGEFVVVVPCSVAMGALIQHVNDEVIQKLGSFLHKDGKHFVMNMRRLIELEELLSRAFQY